MTQYIRSRHLQVEHSDGQNWTIAHAMLGTRLQINHAAYRFLQLFEQPISLEELTERPSAERARPLIDKLVRNRFIVEAERSETIFDKVVQRNSPRFFHCPHVSDVTAGTPDVTFLGVPFDYGNTAEPGARYGPKAIREASAADFHYTLDFNTQQPSGWYDNNWERHILQGVTMADAGDIFFFPGEGPQRIFQKITQTTREILKRGSLPVVIGGDHSVTYPVLAAYDACDTPVDIIHIDAHSDFATYYPEMENHHGNVMSRVMTLPHVGRFYQIGIRGLTAQRQGQSHERVAMKVSPQGLRRQGVEAVLAQIPAQGKYYVSFDIDALDPMIAPATSTPMPGGLEFEQTKELLWAIGQHRDCVGFDLVEINPKRDANNLTSSLAIELMLSFLAAHFTKQGGKNE